MAPATPGYLIFLLLATTPSISVLSTVILMVKTSIQRLHKVFRMEHLVLGTKEILEFVLMGNVGQQVVMEC
jgi:hypothetical protein